MRNPCVLRSCEPSFQNVVHVVQRIPHVSAAGVDDLVGRSTPGDRSNLALLLAGGLAVSGVVLKIPGCNPARRARAHGT